VLRNSVASDNNDTDEVGRCWRALAAEARLKVEALADPGARTIGVHRGSNCGSATMWRSIRSEVREIAWLASIVGGLSVVSVGIAIALAVG
jgi:hypothetical protein